MSILERPSRALRTKHSIDAIARADLLSELGAGVFRHLQYWPWNVGQCVFRITAYHPQVYADWCYTLWPASFV